MHMDDNIVLGLFSAPKLSLHQKISRIQFSRQGTAGVVGHLPGGRSFWPFGTTLMSWHFRMLHEVYIVLGPFSAVKLSLHQKISRIQFSQKVLLGWLATCQVGDLFGPVDPLCCCGIYRCSMSRS